MGNKFELFKSWWNLNDEDEPITDASSAEDSLIEDLILRFQAITKETTDKLADFSAHHSDCEEKLRKLNESVILAYNAVLNNDLEETKKILAKAVNV